MDTESMTNTNGHIINNYKHGKKKKKKDNLSNSKVSNEFIPLLRILNASMSDQNPVK